MPTVASTQWVSGCPGAFSLDGSVNLQPAAWELGMGLGVQIQEICRVLGDVRCPHKSWYMWVGSGLGLQEMLEQAVSTQVVSL